MSAGLTRRDVMAGVATLTVMPGVSARAQMRQTPQSLTRIWPAAMADLPAVIARRRQTGLLAQKILSDQTGVLVVEEWCASDVMPSGYVRLEI